MADDAADLKFIADNIERLYQAMRRAAGNIAGLLQVGQATCSEVRAYNLWALATYNTQAGMLATLRAQGQQNVPELPTAPTLFAWKGVSGEAALQIDCGNDGALSGALRDAMKPGGKSRKLSTNEIEIITQDQFVFEPEKAPSFATLVNIQTARTQQGLGEPITTLTIVAIAGIVISIFAVAIPAIMAFLKTTAVQKSNSKQVALQAEAYANYTGAKLECFKTCTGQGGSSGNCIAQCEKIVDKPDIKLPGQFGKWGWLQWTGFTVVAGVGAMVAVKLYQRKKASKPLFELPEGY